MRHLITGFEPAAMQDLAGLFPKSTPTMLKVDREHQTLQQIEQSGIVDQGLLEQELEAWIANSPEAFFRELGERLFLIGKQVYVGELGSDRVDLLALDPDGSLVVIELKRGDHKLQLLQAVAYAGMVSDWDTERILSQIGQFTGKSAEDVQGEIETFVDLESIEELNHNQRIVLIADEFDYEVLVGAKWLREKHDVEVRCFKSSLAQDGEGLYLVCTCVYPPQGITLHAKPRSRQGRSAQSRAASWEQACEVIANAEIREVFMTEAISGVEKRFGRRPSLFYRMRGKRRYTIGGRQKGGYIWQTGRFEGDAEFWTAKMGAEAMPQPVKRGTCLRMFVRTRAQFDGFLSGIEELQRLDPFWIEAGDEAEPEDDDSDQGDGLDRSEEGSDGI